jgi:hypothetical protein
MTMATSHAFRELRRANPRFEPDFERAVEAAEAALIASPTIEERSSARSDRPLAMLPLLRGRAPRVAGAALVAAAVVAAFVTIGGIGVGGVESASAEVRGAAKATAASADSSGTVTVEITHDGELWAGKTVSWFGGDLSLHDFSPSRLGSGELRIVDGMMYGHDDEGRSVELGSADSVDPASGTTSDEYLAITRADVTGDTLNRVTAGMTGLTTELLDDGSTVYRGTVRAGLVAPEAGFKDGEHIRVFPFGYVAHDEAADPAARLETAVTVGADGLISKLAVEWGDAASAWTYTVTYRDLGSTEPIVAPENAVPFDRRVPVSPPTGGGS